MIPGDPPPAKIMFQGKRWKRSREVQPQGLENQADGAICYCSHLAHGQPLLQAYLFPQVHIGVVFALHLSFWAQFEALEAMQGAHWLCKAAGWLRALPGRRRSVLTFCCISTPKDGKGVWWQRWERGLNTGTSLTR